MTHTAHALELRDVSLSFAGVKALRGIDLSVAPGELHAIIGPNGAGKTSLFNCVSGSYIPQNGVIRIGGVSTSGRAPNQITELGVARMFQNLLLFDYMTVPDNLMLGRHQRYEPVFGTTCSTRRRCDEAKSDIGAKSGNYRVLGA